ncbi:MAG: queuosine precursor transporter [Candidatus Saccharibacteria bacterium]|nr:queuosine precursor transporter [Candidatus Saccharibacteria bacterium]
MNERRLKTLIYLATLSAGVLLISNLAAVKLWDFAGVAVDGGIVVFPLSYILTDVIMEIFGRKVARSVIWAGFFLNLLAVIIFGVVGSLPAFVGWNGQEAFWEILGFVPRIVAGSLLAYVSSQLLNNLVFEKIKQRTGQKYLCVRTLGSSAVAHLLDVLIFETVAFMGVLAWSDFLKQAGFAYLAGMILEVILTPLTYIVVKFLKKYIEEMTEKEKERVKGKLRV